MRAPLKAGLALSSVLLLFLPGILNARSFSNGDAGSIGNGTITRTVTVRPDDFADGTLIDDVDITITFGHRHTAPCSQPLGGFYSELFYRLQGPDGTTVNLVDADQYGYGELDTGFITVRFDDSAAENIGGEPRSGSFRPVSALAAFNGRSPFGTWTLYIGDATSFGTHCFSRFSLDINPTAQDDDDPDGDGLTGIHDNCPTVYNPDQEDGWGGPAGDACDTDWYNQTGQGLSAFVQKNGIIHLHGNCLSLPDGAPRCPVIAAIDPVTFTPGDDPIELTSPNANGWSVWLYYLHTHDGVAVYQVNTYRSPQPQPNTLVDDHFEIHISGGSWRWMHRGGSAAVEVSYYDLNTDRPPAPPASGCQPSRLSWVACAAGPGS